ncbi:hypothetical protein LOZ39_000966 [Ophidiomyces ophidiicola]|nr:hypothetical protein LOZ64_003832 [Ophidiomyces ophidiicola]KAI2008408.1 hypothetical protein LOZ50_002108 [Ophidiomyces ophidiicola]KAI2010938.1 hypothetical protein LOZ49_003298 [Ophidiomyces ophidiicola]KAI2020257.1 hypothetical protein LOZ46_002900 [Ophidiomyces ophidiicola]KAI2036208.1 hypothetical protein LOZ45_000215 [Ophidiomyces ophidiicola]
MKHYSRHKRRSRPGRVTVSFGWSGIRVEADFGNPHRRRRSHWSKKDGRVEEGREYNGVGEAKRDEMEVDSKERSLVIYTSNRSVGGEEQREKKDHISEERAESSSAEDDSKRCKAASRITAQEKKKEISRTVGTTAKQVSNGLVDVAGDHIEANGVVKKKNAAT